jgi:hypothetical protein
MALLVEGPVAVRHFPPWGLLATGQVPTERPEAGPGRLPARRLGGDRHQANDDDRGYEQ